MTTDIDFMLRDLEKQVQDFAMTMSDHKPLADLTNRHFEKHTEQDNSSNQDDVPLQVYKTRAPLVKNSIEDDDEEELIGNILQRSATARRPTNYKPTLTQSRSLRTAGSKTTRSKNENAPPVPNQNDEDLRFAMQRAWAVLDQKEAEEPTPVVPAAPVELKKSNTMNHPGRSNTVKTLTTRIYIEDAKNHKVVQLNHILTTAMVVQYLKKKGLLDDSDDWTLFEIANSHNIERPIREWETILDIVKAWESDTSNALLVKKYSYHYTLTSEAIFHKRIPPMHGWLSIEYKKGKWQKRYCFIKDGSICHAKDNHKGSTSSLLCHLATYDVYTMLSPLKASPSPHVFVIRAQERASLFEREGDYMRCLAVEDQDEMKNWVLSIRCTKSNLQYQHQPERVKNPLAQMASDSTTITTTNTTHVPEETSLRRQKSAREFTSNKLSDDHTKHPTPTLTKNDSIRKGEDKKSLGRSATTRGRTANGSSNPPTTLITIDDPPTTTTPTTITTDSTQENTDGPKFSKGSLLAKEETPEQILFRQQQQQQHEEITQQNKLIYIDDRIKFSKGSLLAKKEDENIALASPPSTRITRSKSVREVASNNTNSEDSPRRHVSLRRKPTSKKHHDVPLPNTTAISSLPPPPPYSPPSNNNTLLQLDDSPEIFHSRELHGRHVKPLLDFGSNDRSRK